jgi:Tfp pilus assembly protein PilN
LTDGVAYPSHDGIGVVIDKGKSMFIFDSSFGIDFKKNHLILTLLKKSFGKIKLVDYGIHPILPEEQKEEREAQVIGLINQFISKHAINKEKVSISVPREKVVARFIRLPVATKENLRRVLEYEASKYTPFEKEEIYFDYHLLKEEKEWLDLFAVFIKKEEVDAYLSLLKKVGIQPISIQIPSTAAINLLFYHKTKVEDQIAILLDVTEPFFEMNLIQGGDWKESFHLPLPSEDKESKIINTFKRSGLKSEDFSKSTFLVYGLDAAEKMLPSLRESNQIKGIALPPLHRIESEAGASRPDKIFSSIGVPLKGLTQTWLDLNLLPLEMRKKVREIGKPLFMILASLALVLSLVWGIGVFIRYRNELSAINAEIRKRKPAVEAVEKLQKQKNDLRKEIAGLQKIRSGEVSKIEILRELSQLLPSTVWIWSLRYTGKELEISGFADSASDLIPLIDGSPLFERVEFLAPVTKERERREGGDKEKERFKIRARMEGRR